MKKWQDDPFTKKARQENRLARSSFKLEEINKKENLLRGAQLILDLGASPGSWSEFCLKASPNAKIVAVDIKPLELTSQKIRFFLQDIETVDFENILEGKKADVVLSDMAPNTTGNIQLDSHRSFELATMAMNVALAHLGPTGSFVVKLFMGPDFEDFNRDLKLKFKKVKRLRPESTRKSSKEIFFIALEPKQ